MTAFGQAIAHELTRRSPARCSLLSTPSSVAPQQPQWAIATMYHTAHTAPPLHPLRHLCAHNFCQRCKRAEQKLITLKSFIKKVYFLLAHGSQSLLPAPSHLPALCLWQSKPRTSNHKMSVVVYFRLVIFPLLCLFLFIWPGHC